ncbi:MAG: hypothetical protein EA380_07390, partial [Phycisphaeraceae bacterium]
MYGLIFFWLIVLPAFLFLFLHRSRSPGPNPRCGSCRYDISNCTSLRCTECGSDLRDVGIHTRATAVEARRQRFTMLKVASILGLICASIASPFLGIYGLLAVFPFTLCTVLAFGSFWILLAAVRDPPHCAYCLHHITDPASTRCPDCKSDLRRVGIVSPRLRSKLTLQPHAIQVCSQWIFLWIVMVSISYPLEFPSIFGPVLRTTNGVNTHNNAQRASPTSFSVFSSFEQTIRPWTRTPMSDNEFVDARIIIGSPLQYAWYDIHSDGRVSKNRSPFSRFFRKPAGLEESVHHPDAPRRWLQDMNIPHDTPEADEFVEMVLAALSFALSDPLAASRDNDTDLPGEIGDWKLRRSDSYTSIRARFAFNHSTGVTLIGLCVFAIWFIPVAICLRHYRRHFKALTLAPPPDKAETNTSP